MNNLKGLKATNRLVLSQLMLANKWPINVEVAAKILGIEHIKASTLLIYLARKGWLQRVRRGLYMPIALEAQVSDEVLSDPWIIANSVFDPCYVGGWDAVSHWGLTDQLFNSTYVFTTKGQKQKKQKIKNHVFIVHKVQPHYFVGLKNVWVKGVKIKISDPSRTLVDLFDNPDFYGGISILEEVLSAYLNSEHKSMYLLLSYIKQVGNRTIYKRLGYLVEKLAPQEKSFINTCLKLKSEGKSKLSPALFKPKSTAKRSIRKAILSTKWQLWTRPKS